MKILNDLIEAQENIPVRRLLRAIEWHVMYPYVVEYYDNYTASAGTSSVEGIQ